MSAWIRQNLNFLLLRSTNHSEINFVDELGVIIGVGCVESLVLL